MEIETGVGVYLDLISFSAAEKLLAPNIKAQTPIFSVNSFASSCLVQWQAKSLLSIT